MLVKRSLEALLEQVGYDVVQDIKQVFLVVADMPVPFSEIEDCGRRIYLCEDGDTLPRESGEILIKPFLYTDFVRLAEKICKRDTENEREIKKEGENLVYKGVKISLSKREAELFDYFAAHIDDIVTREELLKNVWKTKSAETNITDVYINYLRNKIKKAFGFNPIKSVRGKGYMYSLNQD